MGRIILTEEQRNYAIGELNKKQDPEQISGHDTICNHLRVLYNLEDDPQNKELVEEIIYMAKRMANKLAWYKSRSINE